MAINPKKDALISALCVFLITLFCNSIITVFAKRAILDEIQDNLRDVASIASTMTDGDLHKTLINPEQKGSPDYVKLRAPYLKILASVPNFRYIYTCVMKNDKVYFIVDSQQDDIVNDPSIKRKTTANIMEEYPDATPALKKALKEEIAVVESSTYSDDWGTFLSAYVPIYDSQHKYLGIVGTDIDATEFNQKIYSLFGAFAVGVLFSIGISFLVYIIILRIRIEHKRKSELKISRINKMEEFNNTVKFLIEILYNSSLIIKEMADSISQTSLESRLKTEKAKKDIMGSSSKMKAISLVCDQLVETAKTLHDDNLGTKDAIISATKIISTSESASSMLMKSTSEVSNIVEIINRITKKIDMLALNATIEATRVGHLGKGFAVISDEIKNLARNTAEATQIITVSIDKMNQSADKIFTTIKEINEVIIGINSRASNLTGAIDIQKDLIGAIASDVDFVSESAVILESSVDVIDKLSHDTENNVQTLFSVVKELSEQHQALNTQVQEFLKQLDEEDNG